MKALRFACVFLCMIFAALLSSSGFADVGCEIQSPATLGSVDLGSFAEDVAVSGSYAYVAVGELGLKVVDISDPMSPRLVASVDFPSYCHHVVVSGSYAYVSDWNFHVVDISDPTAPVIISSLEVGSGGGLAVSGPFVYLTNGWEGLYIIDISDSFSPEIIGSVRTQGYAGEVSVSGSYACVSQWTGDMQIVDISDPYSPSLAGLVDTVFVPSSIAVAGSYAYMTCSNGGLLEIADISDPSSAHVIGTLGFRGMNGPWNIAVSGSYVYAIGGDINVIDVSDPASPYMVNSFSIASDKYVVNAAVEGSFAYATYRLVDSLQAGGLQIVDISSLLTLPIVGSTKLSGEYLTTDMAVSGAYVYVAREWGDIQIVDVSDPAAPFPAGSVATPGWVHELVIDGSYLYVANHSSGVHVMDISVPLAPTIVASIDTPGSAMDIEISGAYAYVADSLAGLQIVDISNPLSPCIVGACGFPGFADLVAVSGSVACIGTSRSTGMLVVDVTDPTAPYVVGSFDLPSLSRRDMAMSGSYAFIAGTLSGLQVVDLSDPASPYVSASLSSLKYVSDLEIYGSRLYVADVYHSSGITQLHVVDITDPAVPRTVASVDTTSYSGLSAVVAVSGSYAYLAVDDWYGKTLHAIALCPDAGGTPTIALSTTSLTATNDQGVYPPDQLFDVWNSGDGTLSYVVSTDAHWLEVDPLMGGSLGEADTITVDFRTASFPPGDYAGRIIVADPTATNNPQYIDVTVTVYAAAYTLTTESSPLEGGTVSGGGTYDYDSDVTIEAHPNPGWEFDYWVSDEWGVNGSRDNPEEITIRADEHVKAVFKVFYPRLTVYESPDEGGTVTGGGTYVYGVTATIEAHPKDGWLFDHWEGDDIEGSTQNPEQITMAADKTVTAVFVPTELTLIQLVSPANHAILSAPPTFTWTTDGGLNNVFAVDLAVPGLVPFWSTYENLHIQIGDTGWTMPQWIWKAIPSGKRVYWRVRGVDLDHEPLTVITSIEVRAFLKQ